MAKNEGSVAPKERVNIVYKSAIDDMSEDVELPLKMLMLGDYTGKADDTVVEERETVNVDKDSFDSVMKAYKLSIDLNVPNRLDEENDQLTTSLKFDSMKDFSPDSIANQVPELKSLLELRKALLALKGTVGKCFQPSGRPFRQFCQMRIPKVKSCSELGLGKAD